MARSNSVIACKTLMRELTVLDSHWVSDSGSFERQAPVAIALPPD
ncbi:hypothetical protein ACKI1H_18335 [Pseudomonas sp. YH-1]